MLELCLHKISETRENPYLFIHLTQMGEDSKNDVGDSPNRGLPLLGNPEQDVVSRRTWGRLSFDIPPFFFASPNQIC